MKDKIGGQPFDNVCDNQNKGYKKVLHGAKITHMICPSCGQYRECDSKGVIFTGDCDDCGDKNRECKTLSKG